MRERPDKEDREIKPRSLTGEERETEEKVGVLLKSGGEIIKYNHWLPEQCFLTEIKLGDETYRFKTKLPLPIVADSPPPDAEKINPSPTKES